MTVVIPSIPPRQHMLVRALASVEAQTHQPVEVIVQVDRNRLGAAWTRQQGLERVTTPWVAFLDDDDEFNLNHLERLGQAAFDQKADYIFSWYDVVGGFDPRPQEFGVPWDPEHPRQTTITTLVRTSLAVKVGGFLPWTKAEQVASPDEHRAGEDWRFTKRINDAGGKIYHLPERTWRWHHHGQNTSGLPSRWR